MERRETDIERDPATGREVERRRVTTEGPVAAVESSVVSTLNPGQRAVELIYLAFGVIDALLLIRLVLKLLDANPGAGFTRWTYGVTDVLLAPFHNLLPTIGTEQSQLEMSVVVAVLVYALIGWALARLVAIIFFRNVTVAQRNRTWGP
ncbi:MAG TPA: YggT family protein [Candidatus Sulfotelmatobacter sp.]|nr:YggT family protein [Candidatus Sulfotelmatobacter sp.]